MRNFRPLRPECALVLDGWRDRQVEQALAWIATRPPFEPPASTYEHPRRPIAEARSWPETDPAPTLTNRDPVMTPVPKPVVTLIKAAHDAGFDVRAGHALGVVRGQAIGSYRPTETWGVQARTADGARMMAIYERNPDAKSGWKWDRITVSLDGRTFPYAGRNDLGPWLAAGGRPGDLWRHEILKRERAKAAKAKSRPAARKRIESGG